MTWALAISFRGGLCLTLAAAVLFACGEGEPGASTCSDSVMWQKRIYGHAEALRAVPRGRAIENGTAPACEEDQQPAVMRAIEGIPTRLAVSVAGEDRSLYLAGGFLPALPDHPAHPLLFGTRSSPRLSGRDGCRTLRPFRTRIAEASGGLDPLIPRRAGGFHALYFDVRSRVRAPRVAGLPHLRSGQRVRLHAQRCPGRRGGLVVTRLRVL
jgi:hypothetical protein